MKLLNNYYLKFLDYKWQRQYNKLFLNDHNYYINDLTMKLRYDKNIIIKYGNYLSYINGFIKDNIISINKKSNIQTYIVIGHEVTHLLEGTKEYNKLQKAIKKYIKKYKLSFNIKEIFDTELICDFVGIYLFCNLKFVKYLTVSKKNIFIRIFDYTKHLGKILIANSNELRDLEKIKYRYEQAYKYAKENCIRKNKYSIVNKNNKYWVKADRQFITGNNPNVWAEQVERYINDTIHDNNMIIYGMDGDKLTITSNTAGKAKFRNNVKQADGLIRPMTNEEFAAKLRAESHIDELVKVSKDNGIIKPDYKTHDFAKDGFTYRTVYFEDLDGQYYKISMSVGLNKDIKTIYNIGVMKNITTKKKQAK